MEFKKGAAILAGEVGAPVVPVGLRGLYEVWPRGSSRIRLHPVGIAFGAPLEPAAGGEAAYDETMRRLRAAVGALAGDPGAAP
jgi:1-acyl-sn-glycerol-3-phosphate acyltransferase